MRKLLSVASVVPGNPLACNNCSYAVGMNLLKLSAMRKYNHVILPHISSSRSRDNIYCYMVHSYTTTVTLCLNPQLLPGYCALILCSMTRVAHIEQLNPALAAKDGTQILMEYLVNQANKSTNRYLLHTKNIMYFGRAASAQAGNCRLVKITSR